MSNNGSKPAQKSINTRSNTLGEIDRQLEANKGSNPSTEDTDSQVTTKPPQVVSSAPSVENTVQNPRGCDDSSSDGECTASSSSESSSSSDSEDDQDQEELLEKGLVAKKFKTISFNDRSVLKDLSNLIGRFGSLPSDITSRGAPCFQKFGSDLRDSKANVREIYKNTAKIANKEKRKQEKSELKLITKMLDSIIEELLESRSGMFGPLLVSLAKESNFKKVFGSRNQAKIVQQLKMQLQSHKTICQSSLKAISSWKKPTYQEPRRSANGHNFQRSQPKRANPWRDSWKNQKKDKRE